MLTHHCSCSIANHWVDKRGRFIGSSGMLFYEQTAADLYYKNYFHTAPNAGNDRLTVICIAWGMAMIYVQRGTRAHPDHWLP